MIRGLTHDAETGILNRTVRFKGKISCGYAPKEPPNTGNFPQACGFFRMMKQVLKTTTVDGKRVQFQEWTLDADLQKQLIDANKGNTNPRRIDAICMDMAPADMWESHLGKYSSSEGLICKSYGQGTIPMEVVYEGENRVWKPRLFNGKAECPYKDCPDYKEGACKVSGHLHVYPLLCDRLNPYQYSTRSQNTVIAIESALETMYRASAMAYKLKNGKLDQGFMGLAGITYTLVHKKIKSGGREVFVTQIEFSEDFSAYAMKMIRMGVQRQQQQLMQNEPDRVALSEGDQPLMIESNRGLAASELTDESDAADPNIPSGGGLGVEAEKEVATDFAADADKAKSGAPLDAAAATLIEGKKKK